MWQLIYDNSPWPDKPKLSRNLVSATHSFLTVALLTARYGIKYELVVLNSASYFIWDLIYMFRRRLEPLYVYHHLMVIWFLLSDVEHLKIIDVVYYGELSNIFNYIVYHCIQQNIPNYYLRVVQAFWFSYFRIWIGFQQIKKYYYYSLVNNCLLGIYFLAIFWSFKLFKNLLK